MKFSWLWSGSLWHLCVLASMTDQWNINLRVSQRSEAWGYSDLVLMGCAAQASKPTSICSHLGIFCVPIFSDFSQNIGLFVCAGQSPKNLGKFWKTNPYLGTSLKKLWPMFRDFLWKSDPLERHTSVCCNMWVLHRIWEQVANKG